jgi:hypothetical protein
VQPEIRNPKPEIRKKSEFRIPNATGPRTFPKEINHGVTGKEYPGSPMTQSINETPAARSGSFVAESAQHTEAKTEARCENSKPDNGQELLWSVHTAEHLLGP